MSAEDNHGIGGYDRIMGVNGQAQYWARDIDEACHILFRHYEHTYVMPGERFPRRAVTRSHGPGRQNLSSWERRWIRSVGEIFQMRQIPDGRNPSIFAR